MILNIPPHAKLFEVAPDLLMVFYFPVLFPGISKEGTMFSRCFPEVASLNGRVPRNHARRDQLFHIALAENLDFPILLQVLGRFDLQAVLIKLIQRLLFPIVNDEILLQQREGYFRKVFRFAGTAEL